MIGSGHHVKLGRTPDQSTGGDTSFESEFDIADNGFPAVIAWLERPERWQISGQDFRPRFVPQEASDDQLQALTESVVSLAVRTPMNRAASLSLAE
jgi:hypothetical protein